MEELKENMKMNGENVNLSCINSFGSGNQLSVTKFHHMELTWQTNNDVTFKSCNVNSLTWKWTQEIGLHCGQIIVNYAATLSRAKKRQWYFLYTVFKEVPFLNLIPGLEKQKNSFENWWDLNAEESYKKRARCMIDQYSSYNATQVFFEWYNLKTCRKTWDH